MREEKRAGKMREAGEYVDGIFHESIMAIQSGRGRRGTGWDGAVQRGARICRFDANVGMRFIRDYHPRPLGCSPSIPPEFSLFSFRFRLELDPSWREPRTSGSKIVASGNKPRAIFFLFFFFFANVRNCIVFPFSFSFFFPPPPPALYIYFNDVSRISV